MKVIRTKTSEMSLTNMVSFTKTVIENCHVDLPTLLESDKITEGLPEAKKCLWLYECTQPLYPNRGSHGVRAKRHL